jgi:hypothetical protein
MMSYDLLPTGIMKNDPLLAGLLLLLLVTSVSLNAQTTNDEDAVRKLPQMFCDAWAKHDGHELGKANSTSIAVSF